MTRAEIKAQVKLLSREGLGTAGAGDPFTLDMLLNSACDTVAKLDCWYTSFTADLVAGQAIYCVPNLYKIRGATYLDSTGKIAPLGKQSSIEMGRLYGPGRWQNEASSAYAQTAVFDGLNSLRLYPPPSVNRAAGLTLEGFGVPGKTWPLDTDECPLPTWAHEAVIYKTVQLRALQFIGEDAAAGAKAAAWGEEYRKQMGEVEKAAINYFNHDNCNLGGRWY